MDNMDRRTFLKASTTTAAALVCGIGFSQAASPTILPGDQNDGMVQCEPRYCPGPAHIAVQRPHVARGRQGSHEGDTVTFKFFGLDISNGWFEPPWVPMHHRPTGDVLACVRNYGR